MDTDALLTEKPLESNTFAHSNSIMIAKDEKIIITTKEGNPIEVPPEGSLGLLALGYKGLIAWRQARMKAGKQVMEQRKAEKKKNDSADAEKNNE